MLYHLSKENHNNEVFEPKIPDSPYTDECGEIIEDIVTPRVCFSKHINGAVLALTNDSDKVINKEYYVHVPEGIEEWYDTPFNWTEQGSHSWFDHVYVPTKKQVPDVDFTYERWVTHSVKMKCIGKVKVCVDIKKHINNRYRESWRPKVKINWVEKYI